MVKSIRQKELELELKNLELELKISGGIGIDKMELSGIGIDKMELTPCLELYILHPVESGCTVREFHYLQCQKLQTIYNIN